MSAIPSERARAAPFEAGLAELSQRLRETTVVTHSVWPLLAILTAFWCYVAVSNVLYANSMQLSISDVAPNVRMYAHWDARLLQHLFLYPLLILCVWLSMSVGWRPAIRRVPVQVLIAAMFSALASPALMLGERLTGAPLMVMVGAGHGGHWKAHPGAPSGTGGAAPERSQAPGSFAGGHEQPEASPGTVPGGHEQPEASPGTVPGGHEQPEPNSGTIGGGHEQQPPSSPGTGAAASHRPHSRMSSAGPKSYWPNMSDAGDRAMWMASAISFLLTYGFGLALVNGFALYQRFRDAQMRSAALERALNAAHLAALRMQLSPHTLFNLLHTIRSQIAWDPAAAQSMVVQLGDLLRRLLNAGEREYSRLSDELQFVRLYLELQQKRFADRLAVWIAGTEHLPPLWVPSLILQPLVENAVVHGLANHTGPVVIRVEVSSEGETLTLRVVNTVAPDAVVGREGIGLRNVRERLAVQFGERAVFQSGELQACIWIAEIRLPKLHDGHEPRVEAMRQAPAVS